MQEKVKEGLVIRTAPTIQTVIDEQDVEWKCFLRGKFRLHEFRTTHPVCVGDRVEFTVVDQHERKGLIKKIHERKNYVVRKAGPRLYQLLGVNIDQAIIIATIKLPRTTTMFIDRFLIACEAQDIPAIILVNKADIYDEEDMAEYKEWESAYSRAGYKIMLISVHAGLRMEEVRNILTNKITLIAGNSGVGKSSLINYLIPGLNIKTREVSLKTGRGKHTTTFSSMYRLKEGGWIIDTPGIQEFDVVDLDEKKLRLLYPEIAEAGQLCRFSDCLHVNEPDCMVREYVQQGRIPQFRYRNYLKLLNQIMEEKPW